MFTLSINWKRLKKTLFCFRHKLICFIIFYLFILSRIIRFLILILPLLFYKKNKIIQQIERGFQTINKVSLKRFRVNFFLILVIFIIFDLELILVFSFLEKINIFYLFFINIFIIFTLWFEWFFNKIKWINYFIINFFIIFIYK